MNRGVGAVLGAMLLCGSAIAQPAQTPMVAAAQQVLVVQKANVGSSLPSNTEVWVSLDGGVTSKKTKTGDKFDVTVSRDVMLGDYVVIPRGTPGHGQIGYRTGKGAFGKSAKMEFDLVDVKVGDRYIPLTGHYRIEGQGNTGAAVGAVVAVGVFGAFVTGHSATAEQGSEWKGYTKEPIMVALAPEQPTPAIASAPPPSPAPVALVTAPIATPTVAPILPAATAAPAVAKAPIAAPSTAAASVASAQGQPHLPAYMTLGKVAKN